MQARHVKISINQRWNRIQYIYSLLKKQQEAASLIHFPSNQNVWCCVFLVRPHITKDTSHYHSSPFKSGKKKENSLNYIPNYDPFSAIYCHLNSMLTGKLLKRKSPGKSSLQFKFFKRRIRRGSLVSSGFTFSYYYILRFPIFLI